MSGGEGWADLLADPFMGVEDTLTDFEKDAFKIMCAYPGCYGNMFKAMMPDTAALRMHILAILTAHGKQIEYVSEHAPGVMDAAATVSMSGPSGGRDIADFLTDTVTLLADMLIEIAEKKEPVYWERIGKETKQMIEDLGELARRLAE